MRDSAIYTIDSPGTLDLESEGSWRFAVPVTVEAVLTLPEAPDFAGPAVRRSRLPFLRGLAPGTWRVEVRAEDGRVWTGSGQVFDGRSSEVVLSRD